MKKALLLVGLLFSGLFLASCGKTLGNIEFRGADDVANIKFGSEFNVLAGVKAIGDDGTDYSDKITYITSATVSSSHLLDTQDPGQVVIKYNVEVNGETWSRFRYLTVLDPEAVEGQMLVNKDFSAGVGGWNSDSVVYISDGAAMTLSAVDGILQADVVAGANSYTPRFGQMNVPFEQDKTYEVSFRAKSSAEKVINVNVGELLTAAPYFIDFKEKQTENFTLTTEWQEFSFKFTHKLDNKRGGILFELGTVGTNKVDALVEFDWVNVEESIADPDTKAPEFTGLAVSKSILVGGTFNPLAGVSAYDLVDGDLTSEIAVEIKDADGVVVTEIDTTEETTYTLNYTVSDAALNEASFVMTLEIVGMQFHDTNLIKNGDFSQPLDEVTPEWSMWLQEGDDGAVATGTVNEVDETFEIDISNPGSGGEAWTVQFIQRVSLIEGKTYRVRFDVKSSVARDIDFVITEDVTYFEHLKAAAIDVTDEFTTFEYIFTALKSTADTKFEFDLGTTANYQASTLTFDNISLHEAVLDENIVNGDFGYIGWQAFHNDWEGSVANMAIVDGEFVYTLNQYNDTGNSFSLQLIYLEKFILTPNTAYTFKIDLYATQELTLAPFFTQGEGGGWNNISTITALEVTATKQTFVIPVVSDANGELPYEFKFEFGNAIESFEASETVNPIKVMFDNVSFIEDETTVELMKNGNAQTVEDFFYDNSGAGEGTMVLENGQAVIDVTALGGEAYTPHFYQIIDQLTPGSYRLKLVISSSVTRDFRVNLVLPEAGWVSLLPETKYDFNVEKDVEKVVYVDFTVANLVTNVKLELDFGTLGGELVSEVGQFVISEVMVYQNLNS